MSNKTFSESKLREILAYEQKLHPLASLIDYYKLAFQSVFGPAHILHNKKTANQSLLNEIALLDNKDNAIIQDLSLITDFIRVDLHLLKKENINANIFFDILIKSALMPKHIEKKEWRCIWQTTKNYLSDFNLKTFDYDKKMIDSKFENNFAFHHSEIYKNTYNPHYRVVSRGLWQSLLKKD